MKPQVFVVFVDGWAAFGLHGGVIIPQLVPGEASHLGHCPGGNATCKPVRSGTVGYDAFAPVPRRADDLVKLKEHRDTVDDQSSSRVDVAIILVLEFFVENAGVYGVIELYEIPKTLERLTPTCV